jgi:predicted permease
MMGLGKDLRVAGRVLRRSPGFTLVSVLTVGLAIGANAAIFTVVNGVILRPLPYRDADRLYSFTLDATPGGVPQMPLSGTGYWHFRNKNRAFEDMGGYLTQTVPLVGDGDPVQVDVAVSTWSLFTTMQVAPAVGRLFTEQEDLPGGPQLAVISYSLWRSRFGARPDILGSSINLNGTPREVIGIMPRGFAFPSAETDIWVPLRLDPATQNFGGHFLTPVVRLRPGITGEAAHADVKGLIPRLTEAGYTQQWFNGVFTGEANVQSLRQSIIGDSQKPLLIVFGALAVVFLIACSNIANLFLVRARTRARETAVCLAIGATRRKLIQYAMAESLLISLASGLLGVTLAYGGTRALLALQPAAIPRLSEVTVDLPVFGFIAAITLAASVLLGLLPALKAARVEVSAALRDGGRSATTGRENQALRGVLVVTQVALAVILLVGAGLMVRTAQAMRRVDPGFDPQKVLTFTVALPPAVYAPGDRTAAFFADLVAGIRALPGVQSAGAIDALPLSARGAYLITGIEDHPVGPNDFPPAFHVRRVTPGYFEALGIPLAEGRTFEDRDHQARLGTAIISASLKAKYWPAVSPLGRGVQPSTPAYSRIVGVVGDVRHTGLDEPFDDFIYLPMVDSAGGAVTRMSVVVRAAGDPLGLVPAIRAEIGRRDPNLPITDIQKLETTVADSMANTTFTMLVLSIAAGIALVLGCVGIYGLISFIVSQRTAEIGTRMSLGAAPAQVMRLFLGQAWLLAGAGVAIGLGVSTVATRLLASLLFGVRAFDGVTWLLAPGLFLLVATVACLIPASRAAAVDPAVALRRN